MAKRKKSLFIFGSMLIGAVTVLAVLLIFAGTGVIDTKSRELVFKSFDASAVYDGTVLTNSEWELTSGELKEGHKAKVEVSGSQLNVGTSKNFISVVIVDETGADVTEGYNITCIAGTLTVTPCYYEIKSDSAEKIYDGTPLTAEHYSVVSGELPLYHDISVAYSASATNVGVVKNTITARICDSMGRDVTSNFDLVCASGDLEVTKRSVSFMSAAATKQYDGTPLTAKTAELTSGELVSGHRAEFSFSASATTVSVTDNSFTAKIFAEDGSDVTSNYAITSDYGTLTVTKCAITVSTESGQKQYDGTPLTVSDYELTAGNIAEGDNLVVSVTGTQTFVGQSDNTFDVEISGANDKSMTSNYEITSIYGALTVTKREITIETDTETKIYDGTPLISDYWRVVTDRETGEFVSSGSSQNITGGKITVNVFGQQLNVGESDNDFVVVSIVDKNGVDCSANYDVKESIGTLTVTARPLTVQSVSASKDYDGTPLTANGDGSWFIASDTTLADGHDITVVISGERIEVGESPNTIAEIIITDGSVVVTANYDINPVAGALVVKGKNGTPLSGDSGDNSARLWIYSDKNESVYLRSASYGDYGYNQFYNADEYGETINEGDVNNASYNYLTTFALDQSGLSVSPLKIRLNTGTDFLVPYYAPYLYTNDGVTALNTDTIQSSDVYCSGTATEYTVYRYAYTYTEDNGASVNGKLNDTVYSPYELAYREFVKENYLAVPDDTREYMQSVIDAQGFSSSDSNIIAAVAHYIQNAAKYNLGYDKSMDSAADVAVEFLRDYKEGVCRHYATAATVLFRTLGIPARYTVGYLGQTNANAWTTVTGLQAHAWVEVYIDGTGWVVVEVTGGNGDGGSGSGGSGEGGEDGSEDPNAFTVKPIEAYKKYDGTELYPTSYIQGIRRLEEQGFGYEAVISGSQLEVGYGVSVIDSLKIYDSNNDCIYSFDRASGTEVNNSTYNFTIGDGRLHVYEYRVKVSTGSATKIFDGTPLTNNDFEFVDGTALQPGHSFAEVKAGNIASIMGSITKVGTVHNKFDATVVDDATGDDITYKYRIEVDYGELSVSAMPITIRTKGASANIDTLGGDALTCNEYNILDESGNIIRVLDKDGNTVLDLVGGAVYTLVYSDGVSISITVEISGSQSRPGRSQNKVKSVTIVDSTGKSVKDNYMVLYDLGTLSVNR